MRQAIRQATRKQVRSVMFLQGFALTHPETEDLCVCVAFVNTSVSLSSQNNSPRCQISPNNGLMQSTQPKD